ncbi:hypothetical protein TSAR_003111 [Trichomalopsis sarcophagae]|uniref:Uncharacterized protein n=1 Tax=Trichomalopsis sarcophagae TaxID=543379 RepID=A0A232FM78_9HYME|nr:hypothetical protein TSAR_003111 [Trichomalopsis sarcophagae]
MSLAKCLFLLAICLLFNDASAKPASIFDPFGLFETSQVASSSASSKSISTGLNLGLFGASGSYSSAVAHAHSNGRGNGAATAEALANAASDAYGTGQAQASAASSANANSEGFVRWPDSLIGGRNYGSSADAQASSQSLGGSLNFGLGEITAGITNSQASSHSHGQNFGIANAQANAKTKLELGLNLGLGNLLSGLTNQKHRLEHDTFYDDQNYASIRNSNNYANPGAYDTTYNNYSPSRPLARGSVNPYARSRPNIVVHNDSDPILMIKGSIANTITNIQSSAVANVQRIGNILTSPLRLLRPHQRLRSRSTDINDDGAIAGANANASADGEGSSK